MARKRHKKVEVEAELISAFPPVEPKVEPEPLDHVHVWAEVGALREGEFMKQCSICAEMRPV